MFLLEDMHPKGLSCFFDFFKLILPISLRNFELILAGHNYAVKLIAVYLPIQC